MKDLPTSKLASDQLKRIFNSIPFLRGQSFIWKELPGGITNQNFLVEADSKKVAVRLTGRDTDLLGICREDEIQICNTTYGLGITPKLLFSDISQGILAMEFIEGTVLSESRSKEPKMLQQIARLLQTLHKGPVVPGHFSPFSTVKNYKSLSQERGFEFPAHTKEALSRLDLIERSVGRSPQKPCHNDLLASNFIESEDKIWLLDWEYAAMGDPLFDIGNFAANQRLTENECTTLLLAYLGVVRESDLMRVRLMSLASDMREAFWGFLQSTISSIPFDFRKYGLDHLARFLVESNRAEFKEWLTRAIK